MIKSHPFSGSCSRSSSEKGPKSIVQRFGWKTAGNELSWSPKYAPNAHSNESTIPTLDDHSLTQGEGEGLLTIQRRVKLGAILQGSLDWSKFERVSIHIDGYSKISKVIKVILPIARPSEEIQIWQSC
jgi:hypothetical protein